MLLTFIDYFRDWLSEKSTWAGLFMLIAAFNIADLTNEQQLAITAVGISLVARNDKKEFTNDKPLSRRRKTSCK